MQNELRGAEYKSIRTEMLSAVERAFSFWKWGLVSLFSVCVSVLLTLGETKLLIDHGSVSVLQATFIQYPVLFAVSLIVFSALIIIVIAWIVCEIQAATDRLGSYLAVFHEGGGHLSEYKKTIGWHVWNRIEKRPNKSNKRNSKADRGGLIYTPLSLYAYSGILLLLVCMLFGLATVYRGVPQWLILIVGVTALLAVWVLLYLLDRRTRYEPTYWNERWMDLSTRDDDEIEKILKDAAIPGVSSNRLIAGS